MKVYKQNLTAAGQMQSLEDFFVQFQNFETSSLKHSLNQSLNKTKLSPIKLYNLFWKEPLHTHAPQTLGNSPSGTIFPSSSGHFSCMLRIYVLVAFLAFSFFVSFTSAQVCHLVIHCGIYDIFCLIFLLQFPYFLCNYLWCIISMTKLIIHNNKHFMEN